MHINQIIFRPIKAGKTQSRDELMLVEIIKRAAIIIIVKELQ